MITTSNGSTVEIKQDGAHALVILDHPDAPTDMRDYAVGIVVNGPGPVSGKGFQPTPFCVGAMSPEVLRAIADLIEGGE
jgi:hypothetical protein